MNIKKGISLVVLGAAIGSVITYLLVSFAYKEVRLNVAYPKGTFKGGSTFIVKDSLFGMNYWIPIGSIELFCDSANSLTSE